MVRNHRDPRTPSFLEVPCDLSGGDARSFHYPPVLNGLSSAHLGTVRVRGIIHLTGPQHLRADWIASIRDLMFAGYWRAEVMTGDRAGILACRDIRKAIQAQVKSCLGTNQLRDTRAEDLIEQAFMSAKVPPAFKRGLSAGRVRHLR